MDNIINGTEFILSYGTAGSEVALAFSTSASLSFGMDTRDISNKSSAGWRELLEAQRNWSVSTEGLMAFQDAASAPVVGFADLFTEIVARTQFSVVIKTSTTPVAGDYYWSGLVYLSSLELTAPLEDNSTWTASFEGTGVLSQTTV